MSERKSPYKTDDERRTEVMVVRIRKDEMDRLKDAVSHSHYKSVSAIIRDGTFRILEELEEDAE